MRMFLTKKEGSMLTRQVKNVIVKAHKQKDTIGLFEIKSRSKIFFMSHHKKILWLKDIKEKYQIHKGFAFKKELKKHVP